LLYLGIRGILEKPTDPQLPREIETVTANIVNYADENPDKSGSRGREHHKIIVNLLHV
jgi:hypothetical protein